MADPCGAKTRTGAPCKNTAILANGRCRMHGGTNTGAPANNTNSVKHGFYCNALQPDEKKLWERVELGTVDDEIRLMKVKLFRLVKLSGNADVAGLVDSALEVAQKHGEDVKGLPFDKTEIKVSSPQYGDLIIKALDSIAKLERTRLQLRLGEKELEKDDPNANTIDGIEAVEYDD